MTPRAHSLRRMRNDHDVDPLADDVAELLAALARASVLAGLRDASARLQWLAARRHLALLRWPADGRVEPERWFGSDRPGEFGERSRDALGGRCVDAEFVVPAPQILHEGMPGDDHLRRPIGAQPAHGS